MMTGEELMMLSYRYLQEVTDEHYMQQVTMAEAQQKATIALTAAVLAVAKLLEERGG